MMQIVYLLSVWLHILAAEGWIGGMIFLVVVLVPVTRRLGEQALTFSMIQRTGLRFRWVCWVCLELLLLSGAFNLAYRGFGWADWCTGGIWREPFGPVLGVRP